MKLFYPQVRPCRRSFSGAAAQPASSRRPRRTAPPSRCSAVSLPAARFEGEVSRFFCCVSSVLRGLHHSRRARAGAPFRNAYPVSTRLAAEARTNDGTTARDNRLAARPSAGGRLRGAGEWWCVSLAGRELGSCRSGTCCGASWRQGPRCPMSAGKDARAPSGFRGVPAHCATDLHDTQRQPQLAAEVLHALPRRLGCPGKDTGAPLQAGGGAGSACQICNTVR